MSDTPRTDAIPDFAWRCEHHPDHQEGMVTHAIVALRHGEESDDLREHARQLECELAEARAECARLRMDYGAMATRADNEERATERAERAEAECERLREDAQIGKILLRYIDRLIDPIPTDPLVVVVKLMEEEVCAAIAARKP